MVIEKKVKSLSGVNFINPVPPAKQRALLTWFYTSAVSILALIMILSYDHIERLRMLRRLKADTASVKQQLVTFDESAAYKQELVVKKEQLEKNLKEIKATTISFVPYDIVQALSQIIPPTLCLTMIEGTHNSELLLEGKAKATSDITAFADNFSALKEIKRSQLTSITTANRDSSPVINFTLRASLRQQA